MHLLPNQRIGIKVFLNVIRESVNQSSRQRVTLRTVLSSHNTSAVDGCVQTSPPYLDVSVKLPDTQDIRQLAPEPFRLSLTHGKFNPFNDSCPQPRWLNVPVVVSNHFRCPPMSVSHHNYTPLFSQIYIFFAAMQD